MVLQAGIFQGFSGFSPFEAPGKVFTASRHCRFPSKLRTACNGRAGQSSRFLQPAGLFSTGTGSWPNGPVIRTYLFKYANLDLR